VGHFTRQADLILAPFGASLVAGDQALDGTPAQGPAATARECRRQRLSGTLSEPFRQDCDHFLAERSAAFLPAFALAAEVRSCAEDLPPLQVSIDLFLHSLFETVVYGRNCSELSFH
jgi:hypothetical protein